MIGIDLFSGAGGMSLGARMAGIDVQVVVEQDKYAAQTYLANHTPKVEMFNGDIRDFNPEPIKSKQPVIVFGGPPCQGFSTSNQRTRNSENSNNWLFKEFIRVAKIYQPDWIVFENVRGILETEKGQFVNFVKKAFTDLGYSVSDSLLFSEQFGIPQKRARYFIVCSKSKDKSFTFPKATTCQPVTVNDAIGDLPRLKNGHNVSFQKYRNCEVSTYAKSMKSKESGCENHLVTKNSELIVNRYKHIPQGGNWENIPAQLMANYKDRTRCHTGIYKRLSENSPSIVIGNYRKNMLIHPVENRGLSVREAARLQSFPDDFVFKGSIGYQQQQVGNAVPPLLAKAIFEKIIKS
ncbi:MAG: DNA cytosine methyltransferase [Colwellia sp.]|uniref:DNA cytosine methyltransferase n=1 Tax=Alteromonadales TaxID=135622 RepID=UPI001DF96A47|nr:MULTISPECIES: DNA cytosine methyltransferase [Alteromonadales]NQZ26210.1 DNA cytosine methyltransferase [Colwellia sp.]NRA80588.1 DNA cytosine methyltransferase [Pseudoalteromonas sp.]